MGEANESDKKVLLVDPDETFGQVLGQVLGSGYELHRVSGIQNGISALDSDDFEVILLHLDQAKGASGLDGCHALLASASERSIALPVIVYTWDTSRETAMDMMRHGATDVFTQPLDILELKFALARAYRRTALVRSLAATKELILSPQIEGLLGNSKAMEQVKQVIRKVADVYTTVMITGESGTGKEIAARAIHRLSPRAGSPFVGFSPCALPESLIEDELFGHEKGAFTGAIQTRRGRFEEARTGTIFLDEIGDLPLTLQAKLLRVLQERTLERLGSNVAHPVEVRVICATNRNLEKMVQEGTFREDLYFRLSVVRIHMPPLRERVEDVPLLAESILRMFVKAHNKLVRGMSPAFLTALTRYQWPGNVRELQNVIERSLVLADDVEQLGVKDLPPELSGLAVPDAVLGGSYENAVRNFKRQLVQSALRAHAGNKLKAAQELSISRVYLHRLLNQLEIRDVPLAEDPVVETLPPPSHRNAVPAGGGEFSPAPRVK